MVLSRLRPFRPLLPLLPLAGWLLFGTKPWEPGLDTSPEAKEALRTQSFVIQGLWWGSLAALLLLGLRLGLARLWPRREKPAHPDWGLPTSPAPGRKERLALLAAVLAAGLASAWIMAPRLSLSLWGDEEATVTRFIVGRYYPSKDGTTLAPKTPTWMKTFWNFDNGANNHPLNSLLARLSHSTMAPSREPGEFPFREWLIRLPNYLAGIGAVLAAGWLAWSLGLPRAAPLASWLAALHPWMVRWGSEVRGYAYELALVSVALAGLLAALRTGRRRWWAVFALAELLLLLAHFGAVMYLLPLNLALLWVLARRAGGRPWSSAEAWAWLNASAAAAAGALVLLGPAVAPMRRWLAGEHAKGRGVDAGWLADWASYYASGKPWLDWEAENPLSVTLPETLALHPVLVPAALALFVLGLMAGIWHLLRRPVARVWLLPLLLPVPLTCLQSKLSGTLLYPWYAVGFLPLILVLVALGWAALLGRLPGPSSGAGAIRAWLRPTFAVGLVLLFGVFTAGQRGRYRGHSVEPLAETVRTYRPIVNAANPRLGEVISLGVLHYSRLYDPATIEVRDAATFRDWLAKADAAGKPVYVNAANLGLGEKAFPEVMALLRDRTLFSEPEVTPGLQPVCTRYVWRHPPPKTARP